MSTAIARASLRSTRIAIAIAPLPVPISANRNAPRGAAELGRHRPVGVGQDVDAAGTGRRLQQQAGVDRRTVDAAGLEAALRGLPRGEEGVGHGGSLPRRGPAIKRNGLCA